MIIRAAPIVDKQRVRRQASPCQRPGHMNGHTREPQF
jgi:hypothetical protein